MESEIQISPQRGMILEYIGLHINSEMIDANMLLNLALPLRKNGQWTYDQGGRPSLKSMVRITRF